MLILVNQLTYSQTNWTVGDVICCGGMSSLRLRPLSPVFDTLSSEMAGKMVYIVFVVPVTATAQMGHTLTPVNVGVFLMTLLASVIILYAILLAFSALVFWSPGFLFTWLFSAFFQMARYPVGLYPGWLRLVLTWIVPVGVMTTMPAQALTGAPPSGTLLGGLALSAVFSAGATALFRTGLRRYASASS